MAAPWPERGTTPWDSLLKAYVDDPERFVAMLAAAGGGGGGGGPVTTDSITDATAAGKALLTAADAAAARAAIGAMASDKTAGDIGGVSKTGSETVDGTKTFGTIPVLPASDPTSGNQAARKSYVDATATAAGAAAVAADTTHLPVESGAPVGRFRGFLSADPTTGLTAGDWWVLLS